MKNIKKYLIIGVVILLFLFILFRVLNSKKQNADLKENYTTVLVRKAELGKLEKFLDLYAELKADKEIELTSPVTGKVLRFSRLEGQPVNRNQSVVLIDRFEVGARYAPAPVISPITGVVTRILVSEGADVQVGTPVATVGNIDVLEAIIQVPEMYASDIKVGQIVYFKTRAFPDKIFQGTIIRRDLSLNTDTRSLTVRAAIPNEEHILFSGIFAESFVFIEKAENVYIVPESALTKMKEGQDAVFINRDNKAVLTPVTVSLRYRDQVALSQGIQLGDEIVVFGREFLSDGAPIKPLEESVKQYENMIEKKSDQTEEKYTTNIQDKETEKVSDQSFVEQ